MASAGVSPKLKVLYVPDYVHPAKRLEMTSRLYPELSRLMPGFDIALAIAEGPFEDTDGVGAHFERDALNASTVQKQVAALKVDLHVSVVKLARHAARHMPPHLW